MFDPTSRYFQIEDASITENNGHVIVYKKRRFHPRTDNMTTLHDFTVAAGDRLDNICGHLLGDPLQYWRICDANKTMHPLELTEVIGKVIHIPLPGSK